MPQVSPLLMPPQPFNPQVPPPYFPQYPPSNSPSVGSNDSSILVAFTKTMGKAGKNRQRTFQHGETEGRKKKYEGRKGTK